MVHLSGVRFRADVRWMFFQTEDGWAERFTALTTATTEGVLIDEWAISARPGKNFSTVFTRELPGSWAEPELREYFDGNLAAFAAEPMRVEVGAQTAMPESDFWNLIESIPRSTVRPVESHMSSTLANLSQEDLIGWRLQLENLLRLLSASGLQLSTRVEGRDVASADSRDAISCAVILAGSESYRRALRYPRWAAKTFATTSAEWLLVAAEAELSRRFGVSAVHIVGNSPGGGELSDASPVISVPRSWRDVIDERQRTLDIVAKLVLKVPPRSDFWLRGEEQREWRTARVVTRAHDRLIERMLLMPFAVFSGELDADAPTPAQIDREVDTAARAVIRAHASAARESIERLELVSANPAPWNGGVFDIVRRSSLSGASYAQKYLVAASHRV